MSTNYYAVESEDEPHYEGIFLGKRAGGWVPQLKWHDYEYCDCNCPRNSHVYRNWDEFVDFVVNENVIIKNEYGEMNDAEEFIQMLVRWRDENDREPRNDKRHWQIDGWWFIAGDWC